MRGGSLKEKDQIHDLATCFVQTFSISVFSNKMLLLPDTTDNSAFTLISSCSAMVESNDAHLFIVHKYILRYFVFCIFYLSIFIFCYFMLLLHHISEGNIALFTLHESDSYSNWLLLFQIKILYTKYVMHL